MISLSELNNLNTSAYVDALESLYEYSPWVVERSAASRPFTSIKSMQATLEGVIYAASDEEQLNLLVSHPDLAAKIEEISKLTDFSQSEQSRAGFASLPQDTLVAFRATLGAYREKFSHPFILCVSEHSAQEAIPILEARLQSSPKSERMACLAQVGRIGWHRLIQLVKS
ncbi:2-oxo-4-hydroxy-4-carboxy-5-ureidoimidazoline decarboxylase [Pelagicoccus albus]|uniref:2-oxo-4-hydroxy-4-carboxy-5-ureidoimidazoline decarboxylase n=1 Tax=Pelagicoccus albus TaxID=415222 RepID=A0A7X1B6T3_9BACT|nr:2-oxo-4-hydroxy-4-carboxy-5-ureidoimidazoline decarboxylase [Pelagicoccus albus]MBC2605443.1 2-oxo-4-hydroxy-4-carboxy-5-ureidoimidazoline decarboxylase [Pelagicoccus albus]